MSEFTGSHEYHWDPETYATWLKELSEAAVQNNPLYAAGTPQSDELSEFLWRRDQEKNATEKKKEHPGPEEKPPQPDGQSTPPAHIIEETQHGLSALRI